MEKEESLRSFLASLRSGGAMRATSRSAGCRGVGRGYGDRGTIMGAAGGIKMRECSTGLPLRERRWKATRRRTHPSGLSYIVGGISPLRGEGIRPRAVGVWPPPTPKPSSAPPLLRTSVTRNERDERFPAETRCAPHEATQLQTSFQKIQAVTQSEHQVADRGPAAPSDRSLARSFAHRRDASVPRVATRDKHRRQSRKAARGGDPEINFAQKRLRRTRRSIGDDGGRGMDHGGEEGPDGGRQGVGRWQNRPGRALEREQDERWVPDAPTAGRLFCPPPLFFPGRKPSPPSDD